MNRQIKNKTIRTMQRNFAYSIMVILLITASISGGTYAWFTNASGTIEDIFVAGTVKLSEPVLKSRSSANDSICWEIVNEGTKAARVRVRLDGFGILGESAWSDGITGFQDSYFLYTKDNELTTTVDFIQNPVRRFVIGEITVWNDGVNLYIKIDTSLSGGQMQTSKHHITQKPNQQGHAGWSPEYNHSADEELKYTYLINLVNIDFNDEDKTYIAVHSVFNKTVSIAEWILNQDKSTGTWEFKDGWWYYMGVLASGDTLTVCFDGPKGEYTVQIEAEAVQASNNAVDYIWQGVHPF